MPNEKKKLSRLALAARKQPDELRTYPEQLEDCFRYLRHLADPVAWCIDRLGFEPDVWQQQLLRSGSKKIIVNVARQQGKSTTAAAKALHRAVFFPRNTILIVAPALTQASELRRKIDDHARKLKGVQLKTVSQNKREIELENGSRIIILAADEDTVRSYTAHMIIEDEAAMVPDVVYEAMEPMLYTTGGQHILLGTPKGMRRHHFADIWHHGDEKRWDKYMVDAWSNTRIPNNREQLTELRNEKERLGRLWWFQQEYECSFVAAAQGLVYPFDRIRNLLVNPLPRDDRYWQYVLGIDYGFNDSTAFVVLGWQADDPNVYVVESFDKRGLSASESAMVTRMITGKYPFARIVGDMGGFGKGYAEEARRRFRIPIQPAKKEDKRGNIEMMASDLRGGVLKLFPGNDALIDEWSKLPWDEEREMPAEGHKDHLADACLYAWRETAHFLEEVRKAKPKKGTREALELEAEEVFERRMLEVAKEREDVEWWDDRSAPHPLESMNETSFLN